jgi:hypothetical protein
MVWDIRPKLVAASKSAIAYRSASAVPSRSSSPPPQYSNVEDLSKALVFQKDKVEASERYRYAQQGAIMLRASQEAQQDANTSEQLHFSRELYITSVDYLLRGIPSNLSPIEQENLRHSVNVLYSRIGMQKPVEREHTQQFIVTMCRGTAVVIKKSIPKIKQGIEQAIEFESQYHLLEKSATVATNVVMVLCERVSRIQPIDISAFTTFGHNVTLGLTAGLMEGYKVLAEEQ